MSYILQIYGIYVCAQFFRNWALKCIPTQNNEEFWKATFDLWKKRKWCSLTLRVSGLSQWTYAWSFCSLSRHSDSKNTSIPSETNTVFLYFSLALSFTLPLFVLCLHSNIDLLPNSHYHILSMLYARVRKTLVWEKMLFSHKTQAFRHILVWYDNCL